MKHSLQPCLCLHVGILFRFWHVHVHQALRPLPEREVLRLQTNVLRLCPSQERVRFSISRSAITGVCTRLCVGWIQVCLWCHLVGLLNMEQLNAVSPADRRSKLHWKKQQERQKNESRRRGRRRVCRRRFVWVVSPVLSLSVSELRAPCGPCRWRSCWRECPFCRARSTLCWILKWAAAEFSSALCFNSESSLFICFLSSR